MSKAKEELRSGVESIMKCQDKNSKCHFVFNYILALEEKTKWISVKDRLPEKGKSVLIAKDKLIIIGHIIDNDGLNLFLAGIYEYKLDTITHWMPLPEPPEDI